jgi:hypothetical protein
MRLRMSRSQGDRIMTAKVLSIAAALGLLIGSSTLAFAQNATSDQAPAQKTPEKALMDPKAGTANDVPGHLTQETGTGTATFAPSQGTAGPTGTTGTNDRQ